MDDNLKKMEDDVKQNEMEEEIKKLEDDHK